MGGGGVAMVNVGDRWMGIRQTEKGGGWLER